MVIVITALRLFEKVEVDRYSRGIRIIQLMSTK